MKTITIPHHCSVVLDGVARSISLAALVRDTLCADQKWGASLRLIQRSVRVIAAFEAAPVGSEVQIDDEDYALLVAVCEAPSAPYNPAVVRHLLPLFAAIVEAQ